MRFKMLIASQCLGLIFFQILSMEESEIGHSLSKLEFQGNKPSQILVIPDEILFEILKNLILLSEHQLSLAQTIGRFAVVCKRFRNIMISETPDKYKSLKVILIDIMNKYYWPLQFFFYENNDVDYFFKPIPPIEKLKNIKEKSVHAFFKKICLIQKLKINWKYDKQGKCLLSNVVHFNDVARVADTLNLIGMDINIQDSDGNTGLIWASHYGYLELVEEFLSRKKIDVNLADNDGDTALICAIYADHYDVVEALLKSKKIEINKQNYFGYTALMIATLYGRSDMIKKLIEFPGINLKIASSIKGYTAIELARKLKYTDIEALVEDALMKEEKIGSNLIKSNSN